MSVETSGTAIVSSFKRSDAANAFITFSDSSTSSDSHVGVGAAGDTLFLRASNVEQARINNTGLGIGTTSPSTSLHVSGGAGSTILNDSTSWSYLRLKSPNANGGYIQFADADDDDVGQIFYYHGSGGDYMSFSTAATERMRIDSSGNLGVGTTSPSAKLHVYEGSTTGVNIGIQNTERYWNIETNDGLLKIQDVTAGSLARMAFDTSGNIGINTTAPTQGLQIASKNLFMQAGSILMSQGTALFMNASNGAIRHGFHSTGYGFEGTNVGIGTTSPASLLSIHGDGVVSRMDGTADTSRTLLFRNVGTAEGIIQTDGNMHFLQEDASRYMRFSTANTERMRIHSNGAVGIGTTTTTGAGGLLVDNDIRTNSRFGVGSLGNVATPAIHVLADTDTGIYFPDFNHIGLVTGGVERLQIDNSGNIGGGGNDPQYPLDLRNPSDSNQIFRVQFPDANTVQIGTSRMGSGATQNVFLEGQDGVRFGVSGSEVGRFNSSGHFLVNTTSLARDTATSGTSAHLSVSGSYPHIFTRQSSTTGSSVLLLNDTGAGGTIIELKKDGSNVGAVGTVSDNIYIGTGDTGLYFNATNDSIYPINTSTVAGRDNGVDLGKSDTRFKDAYFSGTVNAATGSFTGTSTASVFTRTGSAGQVLQFKFGSSSTGNITVQTAGLGFGGGTRENDLFINTNGNLLAGTTNETWQTVEGLRYFTGNSLIVTRDSDEPMSLNRLTNDGHSLILRKDGTGLGSIGVIGSDIFIGSSDTGLRFIASLDAIVPANTSTPTNRDNAIDLGTSAVRFKDIHSARAIIPKVGFDDVGIRFDNSFEAVIPYRPDTDADSDDRMDLGRYNARWDDVFATNGTISTSDENEKQDISDLDETEKKVAVKAKALLKKYRWKSAVETKGDDARIHFGIIAQDLKQAFESEGLDAHRYGMFCSNTWTDEDGTEQTKMGVRYSELLAFIISTL
tara:strand:- start:754 stop:3624 length:2871 start_codon:yes stop_codon:yes gene_type:complete